MNTRNNKIVINDNQVCNFLERRKADTPCYKTICWEERILNDFLSWYEENSSDGFNNSVINSYIEIFCSYKKYQTNKIRVCLIRIYDYISTNSYKYVTKSKEQLFINNNYYKYFEDYLITINSKLDYSTVNNKKVYLKHFFVYLEKNNIFDLTKLEKNNITKFLNECIQKYSKGYFNKIAYCIREYINFLNQNKIITFNGYDVIPKLDTHYPQPIPCTYSKDEIKKMLSVVDKTTITGKRDYLILLLLSNYGIRIGDVCTLKISDFNFQTNKLSFIQNKTKKPLELPIMDEIKFAFIDYLKNSRPKCDSEYLFITFTNPHRPVNKRCFGNLVPKYLRLANINTDGKKMGAHTLRHSLASNMLNNGASIKQISDTLGHNYMNTTNTYLTIDIKNLQELSLELFSLNGGDFNE